MGKVRKVRARSHGGNDRSGFRRGRAEEGAATIPAPHINHTVLVPPWRGGGKCSDPKHLFFNSTVSDLYQLSQATPGFCFLISKKQQKNISPLLTTPEIFSDGKDSQNPALLASNLQGLLLVG